MHTCADKRDDCKNSCSFGGGEKTPDVELAGTGQLHVYTEITS
jgi:hypothetical protein